LGAGNVYGGEVRGCSGVFRGMGWLATEQLMRPRWGDLQSTKSDARLHETCNRKIGGHESPITNQSEGGNWGEPLLAGDT